MSFFNYFTDSERGAAVRANQLKTRVAGWITPLLARLKVPPDAISYTGLSMLVGVVIWFVSHPYRTVAVLVLYVLMDALDGGYARYLNRPSQSGAFTDVVVDQLGMVVITLGFIYYGFVNSQVGAYYIMIYIVMITFSLLQNAHGFPMQYIFRSKYILYGIYAFWAFFKVNLAPYLLPMFCIIMTISCIQSYIRLKEGFYEEYDEEKLAEMDRKLLSEGLHPWIFNRVWNFLLPAGVIAALLFLGAYTYITTMLERPEIIPQWQLVNTLPLLDRHEKPRGVTDFRGGFMISTYDTRNGFSRIYYLRGPMLRSSGHFSVPWQMSEDQGMCASEDELFLVNKLSRRVLSLDPDLSLQRGIAVANRSFDTTLRAPVSCALVEIDGETRMLITEYMHNHMTLMVDNKKALASGTAKGYIHGWYRNAGFPHGMSSFKGMVYEVNGSLWNDIIYQVDLEKALGNNYIRTGIISSLEAPGWHCRGVAVSGNIIIALDKQTPYRAVLPVSVQGK